MNDEKNPIYIAKVRGFVLKEVILCNAKRMRAFVGYFDSPFKRGFGTYGIPF